MRNTEKRAMTGAERLRRFNERHRTEQLFQRLRTQLRRVEALVEKAAKAATAKPKQ